MTVIPKIYIPTVPVPCVAPKPVPMIVTGEPTAPVIGATDVIVRAPIGVGVGVGVGV